MGSRLRMGRGARGREEDPDSESGIPGRVDGDFGVVTASRVAASPSLGGGPLTNGGVLAWGLWVQLWSSSSSSDQPQS